MTSGTHVLTWMLFTPLAGALLVMVCVALRGAGVLGREATDRAARAVALAASGLVLAAAAFAWSRFATGTPSIQLVERVAWIPAWHVDYFVGVDGLSITLVGLTALVSFVATLASMPWWNGKARLDEHHFSRRAVPAYMALLLLLQTGMMGVFVALDLFLFYVFWELMLLPMYFLIGLWGGPRREYAAIKFFLYTLAGSVLMLVAILGLYLYGPAQHTFDLMKLAEFGRGGGYAGAPPLFGVAFAHLAWVAFFLGFAIKIPMVPFHTWLPDAHVEAPTPVSVILAGVLLKMGVYGILRINLAVLPEATHWAALALAAFGVVNIVYGALVCLAQRDLKRLIAYSSVSHMGFCLLGIGAFTAQGLDGAVLNLWTHGLISPMLFLVVGVIYDRAHHREIDRFGGLAQQMPEYAALLGLAFFASLGLPGLCGFVSEFTVFLGAFPVFRALTAVAALSVVLTAAYYLWTLQRVLLGPLNPACAALPDVNWRERLTLYPLGALIVLFGFWPQPLFELIQPSLRNLLLALH